METEWCLIIDQYSDNDTLTLAFTLFNPDRSRYYRLKSSVDHYLIDDLTSQIKGCFSVQTEPYSSEDFKLPDKLKVFGQYMCSDLKIEELLNRADLKTGDNLMIKTIYTLLPWDLIRYKDNLLANTLNLGLQVPSLEGSGGVIEGRMGRTSGFSNQRFLHILADPGKDLPNIESEKEKLKNLLESYPWLEYDSMVNPTPDEVLEKFRSIRNIQFFHFSGHVLPKKGLKLKPQKRTPKSKGSKGIMSVDLIRKRFPGRGDQVVFINGCDANWQEESVQNEQDQFKVSSIANAFIDSNALAVIAPRSKINDDDACEAACEIWKMIFDGFSFGSAVKEYRKKKSNENPASVAGYSYILYGSPSSKINRDILQKKSAKKTEVAKDPIQPFLDNEIIRDAAAIADKNISPRHLFAALTHRNIIGNVYFDYTRQYYIYDLQELRKALNVPMKIEGVENGNRIDFTSGGRLVIQHALFHSQQNALDELSILKGLNEIGDPEINGTLSLQPNGPRSMDLLVKMVISRKEENSSDPPAVILPSGKIAPDRFLCDLSTKTDPSVSRTGVTSKISKWDLIWALACADGKLSAYLDEKNFPKLDRLKWAVGENLNWFDLSDALQEIITEAASLMEDLGSKFVSEFHLIHVMSRVEDMGFSWENIPTKDQNFFLGNGINNNAWKEILDGIQLQHVKW